MIDVIVKKKNLNDVISIIEEKENNDGLNNRKNNNGLDNRKTIMVWTTGKNNGLDNRKK